MRPDRTPQRFERRLLGNAREGGGGGGARQPRVRVRQAVRARRQAPAAHPARVCTWHRERSTAEWVPTVVCTPDAPVEALVLDASRARLAVCAGGDVLVVQLVSSTTEYRLEAHAGRAAAACFCAPHFPDVLATAGEDRTVCFWDLSAGRLLYRSCVLGASPLRSLAVDPAEPRLAVGADDGAVRFFDVRELPAVREMCRLSLVKLVAADVAAAAAAEAAGAAFGGEALAPLPRVISAAPAWQAPSAAAQAVADVHAVREEAAENAAEAAKGASYAVLAMQYMEVAITRPGRSALDQYSLPSEREAAATAAALGVSRVGAGALALPRPPTLYVATSRAVTLLNARTYETLAVVPFRAPRVRASTGGGGVADPCGALAVAEARASRGLPRVHGALQADTARCAAFGGIDGAAVCLLAGAFSADVTVARIDAESARDGTCDGAAGPHDCAGGATAAFGALALGGAGAADQHGGADAALSIFPTAELPLNSPLRVGQAASVNSSAGALERGAHTTNSAPSRRQSAGRNDSGRPGNRPVTFRSRIKSSGYGSEAPWRKPTTAKVAKRKGSGAIKGPNGGSALPRQYPLDSEPPLCYQAKHALPDNAPVHGGAIVRLAFSPDGARLVTASADKTARCLRLPMSRHAGDGTDFIGHTAGVSDARWSHCGGLVLTCSADRTARLWQAGRSDPLLEMRCSDGGKLGGAAGAGHVPLGAKEDFLHDVRAAQFIMCDRKILLACGAKLLLYRYDLGDAAASAGGHSGSAGGGTQAKSGWYDISSSAPPRKYKLVHEYPVSAQSVLDVACANGIASRLAVVACSNRSLEVHDLGACRVARTVPDAHARAPHCVRLNAPSRFASHAPAAYELFATAAADGTVRLWDMRQERCARCFAGHAGARGAAGAGVAFSPCMRFLAAGGEDKAATLFDLRTGSVLSKLRGTHTDAVTSVDFHPVHPQVATACLDGKVRWFADAA
eukprot:PRCOL_00005238-RA